MQFTNELKFPIGKFSVPEVILNEQLSTWIDTIEKFPTRLCVISEKLMPTELNYTYRPKGWTIKQIIHHCADSHMHAYIRMKLAVTKLLPVINPYDEGLWATLTDALENDIEPSIQIIKGLHKRWGLFLRNLNRDELNCAFYHPENNENVALETAIGLYAWHCNHHLAHIELAIANKN